ncbi:MAG: hypothetical protein HY348_01685 [Nitrospira defluvii]|nr:hypothetical protein [Nitrospira defluvii]
MPTNLDVLKAELGFEVAYTQPEFDLFESPSRLLDKLYKRLEKHGLKLADLRAENSSIIGERHLHCYLFNYVMTVKIRHDKIEIHCVEFPRSHVETYAVGILDALAAVKDALPNLSFKAFAISVALHGRVEGQATRDFMNRLTIKSPEGLGPSTGAGAVFYYGQENDRLLSSLTADISAAVQDAIFLRIHGVWAGDRTPVESLPKVASDFVGRALGVIGLQLKA